MTSSLKRKSLSKPVTGQRIPAYDLALVRGRNKNKAHSCLLELFEESGLSKAELAKMLNKRPEQITRWLGGPGNLTLDTISDLAFALKGDFLELRVVDGLSKGKSNHCLNQWWEADTSADGWVVLPSATPKSSGRIARAVTKEPTKKFVVRSTSNGGKFEPLAS